MNGILTQWNRGFAVGIIPKAIEVPPKLLLFVK